MDEFSIFDDSQSLGSGFVIHPDGTSVSMITDDFTHGSELDTDTEDTGTASTPLAQLIGRSVLNVFNTNKAALAQSKKSPAENGDLYGDEGFEDHPQPRGIRRKSFSENNNSNHNGGLSSGYFDVVVLDEPSPERRRERGRGMSRGNLDMEESFDDDGQYDHGRDSGPIDFLKDPKNQMTYGRRIALALQSQKWYNPRAVDKDKVDASPIENGRSDRAIGVEETTEMGMDIFDINAVGNLSAGKRRAPSIAVAWAYFEHFTLPRHLVLNTKQKAAEKVARDYRDRQKQRQKSNRQDLELAEAGEQHLQTQLYHPIMTPLKQLAGFGLGFGLYFETLRAVAIVLFIAGLMSIPNIVYFSGEKYSKGQHGINWPVRGSAMCTEYEYVPCVDCTYDSDLNMKNVTSVDGESTLLFALKNTCGGATFSAGIVNLVAMVFIIISLYYVSYYLGKKEVKYDEDELTAQDYSIIIKNPPGDSKDPQEWKKFFEEKFAAHTTCITVAVDNENIVWKLIERRALLVKIKGKLDPEESLDMENLERLASELAEKRSCLQTTLAKLPLLGGIPELYKKILKIEDQICDMIEKGGTEGPPATKVFVTFEHETSQRRVLQAMATPFPEERFCFRGEKFLKVEEPGEPSSVRWHNLNESIWKTLLSLIVPNALNTGMVIGAAFIVKAVHSQSTFYSALTISLLNSAFPWIAKGLSMFEVHNYEGGKQTSLYFKITIFRWVNTAIVMTLITPFTSTVMPEDDSVLNGVYAILFSEIIVATLIQYIDIGSHFKRHVIAPRMATQEEMNTKMVGTIVDLAERYTAMTKILFLGLWYCSIFPSVLFMCSFALFVNYVVDRFCLMRTWRPMPKMDSTISRINRTYVFPITTLFMIVISSYAWTQFDFDNLCQIDNPDDSYFGEWNITYISGGENFTNVVDIGEDYGMYQHCNQNLLDIDRITFPALPSFQLSGLEWMSDDQVRLTVILGWASVAIIVIVGMSILLLGITELTRGYKPRGEVDQDHTPFSSLRTPAYVPQVRSRIMPYPLIACSTDGISETLYGWRSLYYPYEYYDLTYDAKKILNRDGRSEDDVLDILGKIFGSFTHDIPPALEE